MCVVENIDSLVSKSCTKIALSVAASGYHGYIKVAVDVVPILKSLISSYFQDVQHSVTASNAEADHSGSSSGGHTSGHKRAKASGTSAYTASNALKFLSLLLNCVEKNVTHCHKSDGLSSDSSLVWDIVNELFKFLDPTVLPSVASSFLIESFVCLGDIYRRYS